MCIRTPAVIDFTGIFILPLQIYVSRSPTQSILALVCATAAVVGAGAGPAAFLEQALSQGGKGNMSDYATELLRRQLLGEIDSPRTSISLY